MPLQFNVSSLLKEPVGSTREYEVDGRALIDEDGPTMRDVTGHVKLLRTNEGVLASATVQGADEDRCSRCLKGASIPVALQFEEIFYPQADIMTGARTPRSEDPEAFRLSERWILDLEEPIRQFWTVARPMQPLCRPDCRGLCPQCGQDWNEKACDCAPPADERWSALDALRRK